MKKYLFPLFLLAMFATVSCVEEDETDNSQNDENNTPQTETIYKLKEYKLNIADLGVTNVTLTYNDDLVTSATRNFTSVNDESSTSVTDYTYDSEGRVTEAKIDGVKDHEFIYSSDKIIYKGYYLGEPSYEYEWTLNSDGKIIKSFNVNFEDYDEYQWDGENLLKMSSYNADGELTSETVYVYDEEILTPGYGTYYDEHPAKQSVNVAIEKNWIYDGDDDITIYSLLSNDGSYLTKRTFDSGYFGTSTTTYTYETTEIEVE